MWRIESTTTNGEAFVRTKPSPSIGSRLMNFILPKCHYPPLYPKRLHFEWMANSIIEIQGLECNKGLVAIMAFHAPWEKNGLHLGAYISNLTRLGPRVVEVELK